MFVPEFEQVMNQLALGQVSEPLVSRFGVHLIEVLERRRVETSLREQRDAVRAILREKNSKNPSRCGPRICGPAPTWNCVNCRSRARAPRPATAPVPRQAG